MALRDQPYLPLYVQDYLTDEKLNMCSASTQGVYIKIICLFHKSEKYGGILLKQKDKQKESDILNFATKLAKLLPFDLPTISKSLSELIEEDVLKIDSDLLFQKRMVSDNNISIERAKSGKKGGESTQKKYKESAKAKSEANTEYEDENEDVIIDKKFKKPTIEEVKEYFDKWGYENAEKFFNYYETNEWKDSRGHKIKNWKQKAQGVWFKEENKKGNKYKLPKTTAL